MGKCVFCGAAVIVPGRAEFECPKCKGPLRLGDDGAIYGRWEKPGLVFGGRGQ